jgi:hypothetical protein
VKAQCILEDLQEELASGKPLQFKHWNRKRGFLIHLQRTFPCIAPFLKGIHNTLDGWRPGKAGSCQKEIRP